MGGYFLKNHAVTDGGGLHCWASAADLNGCIFASDSAHAGAAIYCDVLTEVSIASTTIYGSHAVLGAGLFLDDATANIALDNTIIAFCTLGGAVRCPPGFIDATCCDIYGNVGGDWSGCISGQLGVNGNINLDPLLCDPANGDFHLEEESPCAPNSPPNPECDQMGVWPVGCNPSAVEVERDATPRIYLSQIAPNPSCTGSRIVYEIPTSVGSVPVHLRVFDSGGRLVRTLVEGMQPPGSYAVTWDGDGDRGETMAAGVYYCHLRVGEENRIRAFVRVK
jgi:hypothetical protein